MKRTSLCVCAALLAAACGGDDDDGGAADAAVAVDAPVAPDSQGMESDGGDFVVTGDELRTPADFPRLGCVPGSLAGLEPRGVWAFRTVIDYGGGYVEEWADETKIEDGIFGDLQAWYGGGLTAEVTFTDDDLLVRRVSTSSSGALRVRSFDVCGVQPDGTLVGHVGSCSSGFDQRCDVGTLSGRRVERLNGEAEAQGLTLLGEFRGKPTQPWDADGLPVNVRVVDNVAYLAIQGEGVRIVDVSDPAHMKDLGQYHPSRGFNDLKVFDAGGRRYVAATQECTSVNVIDVTDATDPQLVSQFPPAGAPRNDRCIHTLALETRLGQTLAYYGDYDGELNVWDVSDPAAPALLGAYAPPDIAAQQGGYLHDLSVVDGVVYASYWSDGFKVIDATDPANMTMLGEFTDYSPRTSHSNWTTVVNGCRIAVHGDENYGAHLRVIGVDPACPATFMQLVGELSLRPEVSIHNILAFGDKAYVSWYQDGVRVVDLADPAHPDVERWFDTWDPARSKGDFFDGAVGLDVDLAAGRIYVADATRGLLVLGIE